MKILWIAALISMVAHGDDSALMDRMETSPPEARIGKLCTDVKASFQKFGWKADPCEGVQWKAAGVTVEGRPLIYTEFGDPNSKNTTLVLTLVHGDEVTPLYLGTQLIRWMEENRTKHPEVHVVIAPIVNPDGFFRSPRIRMNARGVDINRNFRTRDWDSHALKAWKSKFKSDPRRYPGPSARSEPETVFQELLIERFKPQKILSVHAPLNFMDYDGPNALSLAKFPKEYVKQCLKLRASLKAISSGFFPGSLGNYAGQELGIPTLTLELPTADPRKADAYWKQFRKGIDTMIGFQVPSGAQAGM